MKIAGMRTIESIQRPTWIYSILTDCLFAVSATENILNYSVTYIK